MSADGYIDRDPGQGAAVSRRDRHQDPLKVERPVESERRAGLDLAWIVVVGVLLCAGAIYWSVPDSFL